MNKTEAAEYLDCSLRAVERYVSSRVYRTIGFKVKMSGGAAMTLTIEIEPETQRAIEGKAARLGVPVERYAAGVLRRDVENNELRVLDKRGAAFLALLDKARPVIAAGVLQPLTSESINNAIDATREYSNE